MDKEHEKRKWRDVGIAMLWFGIGGIFTLGFLVVQAVL
ncbi:hypothetical protein LCGC14_1596150 [marine sediment metagenome]|uniref:Uncharacterized protein n=1 Tax=marine sediment metagenome TaxID=412755 RepID=A0A0F9KT59_9ZZZZ